MPNEGLAAPKLAQLDHTIEKGRLDGIPFKPE
jgi:hypothetical protein